jgi:hypothetical protein
MTYDEVVEYCDAHGIELFQHQVEAMAEMATKYAARRTVTDEQRKKAAKALVETYLGFPAPDREPCELDLKAVDVVHAILSAGASDREKESK